MAAYHYMLRGGLCGAERMRLLARVLQPATVDLLRRIGVEDGMTCLDAGCGTGEVTFDLARLVGGRGHAVGVDLDDSKLEVACAEARELGLKNVEFRLADAAKGLGEEEYDVVCARFLLGAVPDPLAILRVLRRALRPGGTLLAMDQDVSGSFAYPEVPVLRRFRELYSLVWRRRNWDPDLGPRLPGLLQAAGLVNVQMRVEQPAGFDGEVKMLPLLAMEEVAGTVIEDGLATEAEVEELLSGLSAVAREQGTVVGGARVFHVWGR